MSFTDTHTHYLHKNFNKDREELINRLLNTGVDNIIECGTNTWSNEKVIDLVKRFDKMYATIGYFPTDTKELENNETLLLKLEKQILDNKDKVLGIGEIGLDYYHHGNPSVQRKWFVKQLRLAQKLDLPVCIHSREAEFDTLKILEKIKVKTGVIHCYSYGVETMKKLVELGYYFGVGGSCTYRNNMELRNAIKEMPLDRIVLETDCPFLPPLCYGRQRNESSKIEGIITEIAKLKKIPEKEIIEQVKKNVQKLYGI